MDKKHFTLFKILLISTLFLMLFPKSYEGYTDFSTYKIETGRFSGEEQAKSALNQLQKDTGWIGEYQTIGESDNYYQIITGGFSGQAQVKQVLQQFVDTTNIQAYYAGLGDPQFYYQLITGGFSGESKVKQVLQQFEKETGIRGTFYGIGNKLNYYQLITGGFSGESNVKHVLQQFKNTTGIHAYYVGIGDKQNYYQIITGGFSGEAKVKQVLQQFKRETGINGNYIGLGTAQSYYQIISGGFSGESNVKQVLQQFERETGIKASYIPIGNNRYQIISEAILGLGQVNKGREFFKSNEWSVTYKSTGQTGYERYQIISEPVLGLNMVYKGREFFKSNTWSVTYKSTGQTSYERYQIISESLLGLDQVNKGREFFKSNNWSVTYKSTGQTRYERYQIKSEPVLGLVQVNKAREFFKKNNWSITYKSTGQTVYDTYQIKSVPVLGMEQVNKGREFFEKNNWSVTYVPTGSNQDYYQVVITNIVGYDKVNAAIQKVNQLYGWSATAVKTKNGPQLMYTDYGMTLGSMVDKQMAGNPQTDKYRNESRYIHVDYVDLNKQTVIGDSVNLRTEPSTNSTSKVVQQLNNDDRVIVIGRTGDWVEVRLTWQNATSSDVNYYLNPNNFSLDNKDYYQFLKLSKSANLNAREVDQRILNGKGILAGQGQAFVEAANTYNINEVYLISHSLLETGNGSSNLATGVVYNGKTVYNMYGYGAYDSCPLTCGAQKAYENGWFTPEAAIIGGAKFISNDYIYNPAFEQDTLYKMRWNPEQTWHQYATDIGWSYKQVNTIYNLYQMLDNYTLYYDVPSYN